MKFTSLLPVAIALSIAWARAEVPPSPVLVCETMSQAHPEVGYFVGQLRIFEATEQSPARLDYDYVNIGSDETNAASRELEYFHAVVRDDSIRHVGRSADDETRIDLRERHRGQGPVEGVVILDDVAVFKVRCR
jgi:hypothetical protein